MSASADDDDETGDPRTVAALADAAALTGAPCRRCSRALCGHEAVYCLVLGYKGAPHCLPCIAAHMGEALAPLRERGFEYVRHHDCFLTAWRHAGDLEGHAGVDRPPCVFALDEDPAAAAQAGAGRDAVAEAQPSGHASWDAGGMGCGDLVLELRQRLAKLPPRGLLHLIATDPGAPTDLPAWCSMTGHTLESAEHPDYRIRRRP
ncbi:MAG: sulfurtransferase TusA family protein [Planctomycetota bacterium]